MAKFSAPRLRFLVLAQVVLMAFLLTGPIQAVPLGQFLPKPVADWLGDDWLNYIDYMIDFRVAQK